MAQNIQTMVPFQVLQDIDNARNPMQLTERLERAATENQFMNGKIAAIDVSSLVEFAGIPHRQPQSYRRLLKEALVKNFPETAEYLQSEPSVVSRSALHSPALLPL